MAAHAVCSHPQTTCMSQQETRTLVTVCAEVAVKNIMEKMSGQYPEMLVLVHNCEICTLKYVHLLEICKMKL